MLNYLLILKISELIILWYVILLVRKTHPIRIEKRLSQLETELSEFKKRTNEAIEVNHKTHGDLLDSNYYINKALSKLHDDHKDLVGKLESYRLEALGNR